MRTSLVATKAAILILLSLTACSRPEPLAYSKDAPAGVYPAGLLSGASFVMVGLRFKF